MKRGSWKRPIPWGLVLLTLLAASATPAFAEPPEETPSERKQVSLSLQVVGHRMREICSGTYEVVAGRTFSVTVATADLSSADVRFELQRAATGDEWITVSTFVRSLVDGRALLVQTASTPGRWRVVATTEETHEHVKGEAIVSFLFVAPRWRRFADGGVLLTVPYYKQRYRLSCEAATLRMAHNYHDPSSIDSDGQVLRVIGVDRRARRGGRWGNPNTHFVGDPNGYMMRTGYGVHAGPIARAATRYDTCRPAVKLYRPSRQSIARYLNNGFPVIVWGAHAGRNGIVRRSWRAWDGTSVRALEIEHTWTVVGFRGKVTDPTAFIIHNPSGRARQTVTRSQFYAFTRYFRSAVVVRG